MDNLLTIEDRARLEHRSVHSIHNARYRGDDEPPAIRTGRKLLWWESEWRKWMNSRTEQRRAS